jgi:sulfur carrier protein ThiS
MKIQIKLFATLREGRGKILERVYEEETKIKDILKDLDINEKDVAIILNKGINAKLDTVPSEGDYLSIFPPVGGG